MMHFLCDFKKRMNAKGDIFYIGSMGNSRLLLFTDGDDLKFYLGGQIEVEKKSFYNRRSGTNQNGRDQVDGTK